MTLPAENVHRRLGGGATFTLADYRRGLTLPPPPEPRPYDTDAELDNVVVQLRGRIDWMDRADCRGMDPGLFFPERGESTAAAKAVCRSCPVQTECRDFADENHEMFGIWGGASERQRRGARRARPGRDVAS